MCTLEDSGDGLGSWVPATGMGDLDCVPCYWLQLSPVPATADVWGVNWKMGALSLCPSDKHVIRCLAVVSGSGHPHRTVGLKETAQACTLPLGPHPPPKATPPLHLGLLHTEMQGAVCPESAPV